MVGVYCIKNKITSECYIGKSLNIERRWESHKAKTIDGKYSLYRDFRFYGINEFSFSVIENCSKEELDAREKYWIEEYQRMGYKLYNIIGVAAKEANYKKRYRTNQRKIKKY